MIERELGNWGTGELGNWGTGELGNWGTGELGNWGTGELGNWGTGELGNWGTGGIRKGDSTKVAFFVPDTSYQAGQELIPGAASAGSGDVSARKTGVQRR
ncbi:hypothetical protein F3A87_12545 [Salmonella enterica subsp. enterica serovar Typhi]|nr:hypothetical protein [Salmonella enterica subsp. enterica serovar Typhi]